MKSKAVVLLNSRALGPHDASVINCTSKLCYKTGFFPQACGVIQAGRDTWRSPVQCLLKWSCLPGLLKASSFHCCRCLGLEIIQPRWGPGPAFQPLALWQMVSSYPAGAKTLPIPPESLLGWVLLLCDTGQLCLQCMGLQTCNISVCCLFWGITSLGRKQPLIQNCLHSWH